MGKSVQYPECPKKRPEMCREYKCQEICAITNKDKICYYKPLKPRKKQKEDLLKEHELCSKYFKKQ